MSDGDNPHHFEFDLDRGIRNQVVEKLALKNGRCLRRTMR